MIGEPLKYTMKALALRRRLDLPSGWQPIFERLVERLSSLPRIPGFVAVTVRHGHLHLQLATPDPMAQSMIDEAIGESCRTCDVCGAGGTLERSADRWAIRCSSHRTETR